MCSTFIMYSQCTFTYISDSSGVTTFTGSTDDPLSTYSWDFGDGTTATGQNVTYNFNNSVWNYVCLNTVNSLQFQCSFCDTVIINDTSNTNPCNTYYMYASNMQGYTTFTGYSNDPLSTYYWTFGDGTIATGQSVSHYFGNVLFGYACLNTVSSSGTQCSYCDTVFVVYNPNPCSTYFTSITDNQGVTSFNGYSNDSISSFYWDFGDGSTATGQSVTHNYSNNQWYYVCLNTENSQQYQCTYCDTVFADSTNTSGCQAYFYAYSDSSNSGNSFYFYDYSQGNPTNWEWDFGDGTTSTLQYPSHTYSSPGTYTVCLFISDSICQSTYCDVITVNQADTFNLTGTVYLDINNNCTQDIGENGIYNIAILLTQGSNTWWAWTDWYGNFTFNVPVGTYNIEIGNSNGYTISCNNSLAHSTTVTTGNITSENFALDCSGFDIGVSDISLMNGFYPGYSDIILPHVGMFNSSCNASGPGQVIMVLDPLITYNSPYWGVPTPTVIPAVTGDTLIWNVSDINNIGYFSYWDYAVNVTPSTSAQMGDTACITMIILPTVGDANTANNTFTRCFEIGVSYDPNMKEVSPKGTGVTGDIPATTDYLNYVVHFQNTGTARAGNIYVLDTLDANLDISTLEIVASSHPMTKSYLPGNTLKFMFSDIMLPDSNTNSALSHGSISYRIKIKQNLAEGTQIKNTASIFFDYNSAIVTNTTLNTIAKPLSVKEEKSGIASVNIYPNPVSDMLNMSFLLDKSEDVTVKISDVTGRIIYSEKINSEGGQNVISINTSSLSSGLYFVHINYNGQNISRKFAK